MSRILISTFLSIILNVFSASRTFGQGIMVLSNLDESSRSSVAVAADAMLSSPFLTGNNPGGYFLEAVQVSMEQPLQNPSGFSISLYELITENTNPTKITDLSGSDPVTSGIFTYTALLTQK